MSALRAVEAVHVFSLVILPPVDVPLALAQAATLCLVDVPLALAPVAEATL